MAYEFIPNKNRIMENEKMFLEKKFEQGWRLEKKGILFYKFIPATPQAVTYEIDMLPKALNKNEMEINDWDIVALEKTYFKGMQKVYYYTESSESRLMIDEKKRLQYYNHKKSLMWGLNTLSIIVLTLMFTLFIQLRLFSLNILYIAVAFTFLSLYSKRTLYLYERAVNDLNIKFDKNEDYQWYYVVELLDLDDEKRPIIVEKLSSLGYLRKVNNNLYRLDSILNKKELLEEVRSMGIEETNIKIISNPYDLLGGDCIN